MAENADPCYTCRVMTPKTLPSSPFCPRHAAAFAATLALFALPGAASPAAALDARTDAPPLSYAPGDTATFSFPLSGATAPVWLHWSVRGALATPVPSEGAEPASSGTALVGVGQTLRLLVSRGDPGFAVASAFIATGPDATPLRVSGRTISATAAAGFGAGSLRPIAEPADFDKFWGDFRTRANAIDLSSARLLPAPPADAARLSGCSVRSFRIEIGGGVRPATGWIVVPEHAAASSLPLELRFFDYGDGGRLPVAPADGARVASIQINAHGFELGRDKDYYKAFMTRANNGGHGGGYGFHDAEYANPETAYFAGMVLRGLVAARFAATLPEWNGRDCTATGAGQGAWLATAVASLCDKVSALELDAPWLCGLGGEELQGRLSGWRPLYQPSLRYFDGANFAARVSAPCSLSTGLADSTCPPDAVAAFVNALRGPKTSRWTQNRNHANRVAGTAQEQVVEGELPGR